MIRGFVALVLFAAWLTGAVPAVAQDTVQVGGTYNVFGTNANGSQYTGTVVIVVKGSSYRFTWLIDNGSTYKGIGKRKGDTLVVNWGSKYPVIYQVGADGALNGTWDNGRATETLVRQK